MPKIQVRFTPFWDLTNWGFLFRNGSHNALRLNRGCDEHHNPSRYIIIPLIGSFIFDNMLYDRNGPEHLYAHGPGGWEGAYVPGCVICEEIKDEVGD